MRLSGVLVGRYPSAAYAGGNPWQLLTAFVAEIYFLTSYVEHIHILEN